MKINFTPCKALSVRLLLSVLTLFLLQLQVFAQTPLVSLQNGQLVYNQYANERQQNAVNKVPDFSNAGYKGGGVALPVLPVMKTVEPVDGDSRALIQAAIDEVSALAPDANGFRGAVLLKAGVYPNTSKPTEDVPAIIDNSTSTKYYRSGRTNLWVQYQSTIPAILNRYTITSANDVPERDPKNWKLLASNDGVNWAVLDSQVNQSFATRFLTKTYTIDSNTTLYTYYRLHITANNSQTGTQFAEWELFERRIQTIAFGDIPDQTFGDDPFELLASSNAGLPLTIEVVSGPGILVDSFVTISGAGSIVLRASQPGNEQYFPAVAEKTVTVNKATQSISFDAIAPKLKHETVNLSAIATSGLPVNFSVVSGPATLTGNSLKLNDEGLVTVQAEQPGNENYAAASPVQQTILVLGLDYLKPGIALLVYPNPTTGPVKVKLFNKKKERGYSFLLIDRSGNIVTSAAIPAGSTASEVNFNISHALNGLYFLHITDGVEKAVRIIVKY